MAQRLPIALFRLREILLSGSALFGAARIRRSEKPGVLPRRHRRNDLGLLFEGFPELKELFLGVNMQHQAAMLTMALQVIVQHYRKSRRGSEDYLVVLGDRHRERGVCARKLPEV